jgi:hypothetical protein
MPIIGPKRLFDFLFISEVPDRCGVYALWSDSRLIYYGKSTDSIRKNLQIHKTGKQGWCGFNADYFQFEVTDYPDSRVLELLDEYRRNNGYLPQCNDFIE